MGQLDLKVLQDHRVLLVQLAPKVHRVFKEILAPQALKDLPVFRAQLVPAVAQLVPKDLQVQLV